MNHHPAAAATAAAAAAATAAATTAVEKGDKEKANHLQQQQQTETQREEEEVARENEAVHRRYLAVANSVDEHFFAQAPLPSRSPYRRGERMGRGADYYETFKVRMWSSFRHATS
jgi:hypothetical protein